MNKNKLYSRTMKLLLTAQQSFLAIEGSSQWDKSETGQSGVVDEMARRRLRQTMEITPE